MTANSDHTQITIRLLDQGDLGALAGLAERDSARVPAFPVLGAELGGRLIAALEVGIPSASVIADPFVRTEQVTSLLKLRGSQLRNEAHPRRRRRMHLPRARGALAGSPPGGGGRLLRL